MLNVVDETYTSKHFPAEIYLFKANNGKIRTRYAVCSKLAISFFEIFQPLGAIDYLTIANEFHTVIVENIPVLSAVRKVETRRFINMVDSFYDKKVAIESFFCLCLS